MSWLQDAEVTLPKTPDELLDEARATKIKEINEAYNRLMLPLVQDYPEIEQKTWAIQNEEAKRYLAWHESRHGPAPDTPVLNAILSGRNSDDGVESLYELCVLVREKASRFAKVQNLTGQRQRLVQEIEKVKKISDFAKIGFNM